jgi:4-hydroxy-tetrahydrodipicolinate reductase
MKVLIIGYGNMGKMVETCLHTLQIPVAGIIDHDNDKNEFAGKADVAIEFSTPHTAVSNIMWCFENKIPVVCGTTAWLHQLENIQQECVNHNGTLVYASNFSIGMNIFFKLNTYLSNMMNAFTQYSPDITEIHHTKKIDKPSGTALVLAQDMVQQLSKYNSFELMEKVDNNSSVIPISCLREGDVKGIHEIQFDSEEDSISIKHTAKTRRGFAMGAVMSAFWAVQKKGVFSFSQYFEEIVSHYQTTKI